MKHYGSDLLRPHKYEEHLGLTGTQNEVAPVGAWKIEKGCS